MASIFSLLARSGTSFAAGGALAMGLGLGGLSWIQGADARLIARDGTSAEAQVTALTAPEGNRPATVTFGFETAEGRSITATRDIARDRAAELGVGGALPVTYSRSNPEVIELAPGALAAFSNRLGMVGWLFGIGGIILGLAGLPGAARRLRAETGPSKTARITEIRKSGRGMRPYTALWAAQDGTTGQTLHRELAALPQVGDTITLRCDPKSGAAWWDRDL